MLRHTRGTIFENAEGVQRGGGFSEREKSNGRAISEKGLQYGYTS